jgi:hypothetical protein
VGGIDTAKLSYKLSGRWWDYADQDGFRKTKNYGTKGMLWWSERIHDDGTRLVVKGIGTDAYALWEASVPKYLGLISTADPADLRLVDQHIRSLASNARLPAPNIRRLDLTEDLFDPDGALRAAAIGWNPHARSRYVQARYQDDETVWQHNKSRGVRVYDKYQECQQEWARDLTRIEYQVRGDWCQKLGVDRLYRDFETMAQRALDPVVLDLQRRIPQGCSPTGSSDTE